MGDMGEIFRDMKKHNKQKRIENNNKWYPILINLGAIQKSDGVLQLNDWFLYPTKGFAMNRKNSKKRMSLHKFIKRIQQETEKLKNIYNQIKWKNEFKRKFFKELDFDGELYKYIKKVRHNDK